MDESGNPSIDVDARRNRFLTENEAKARSQAEHARVEHFRRAFQAANGAKEAKNNNRSTVAVLKAGGEPEKAVKAFLADFPNLFPCGATHGPFDHGEVWSVDRKPAFLIGHPYQIDEEDREVFSRLGGLGLHVLLSPDSWYGFGTIHVRVSVAKSLPRVIRENGWKS